MFHLQAVFSFAFAKLNPNNNKSNFGLVCALQVIQLGQLDLGVTFAKQVQLTDPNWGKICDYSSAAAALALLERNSIFFNHLKWD